MSLKIRIAETEDFSKEVIQFLQERAEVSFGGCEDENQLKELLEEIDVFWFRLKYKIGERVLSENTRCKIIATPVTGIDHIDESACAKYGIKIACLRGETAFLKEVRATAEMTIALTFAVMRNLVPAANDVLEGNWRRDLFRGLEVYKKRVGIIGLGRLGIITAEYFHALGAKVYGYDIVEKEVPSFIMIQRSISELVQASDIITIHVKYDASTHHLINEETFQAFNDQKWLINTSRGGVVEESALLNCLREGRMAGAALDVLQNEYEFDIGNPLLNYAKSSRNLLIVPHIGGNTYESFEKTEWFIAKKVINLFES